MVLKFKEIPIFRRGAVLFVFQIECREIKSMQIHFTRVGMYIVRVQEPDKSGMQIFFESSYLYYDLTFLIVLK